ncbi:MAG: hypothetical protein JSS66_19025 [Armatimonadetes bacterium]|nr:hypothetical protein [Armatimonadota bacterium]
MSNVVALRRRPEPTAVSIEAEDDGLSLVALRKQFTDFASVKLREIDEAREAWRYYHGQQWTDEQIKVLRRRGQPVITFNRLARKINGLVGVVQKLRNDPKAFPRTIRSQGGADLATSVLRYVLDTSRWIDTERDSVLAACVAGIGVGELSLVQGDQQDPDIRFDEVDPFTYFYDPRSVKPDFSDARYDGVSRWVSEDEVEEMFPGKGKDLAQDSSGYETTPYDFDREFLWINERKRIRLVEHWYKHRGQWKYCIYANWTVLARGVSPFKDEDDNTRSRYVKFSAGVDQDGDRYGFVRIMKGPQDAINQHRSKAMHIMNTRQVIARQGAFTDTEKARREIARPDGFVEYNGQKDDIQIVTGDQEFLKQTQYFQDAREEIENYGPSPAIVGTGINQRSGRALAMMQQNGIAELGPFLGSYRRWKLEIYRSIWCAVRTHWQAQRYVRVTDDQDMAQFIQINALRVGPNGMPQLINSVAALDVDIILDEGPDTTNVMGDVNDTLMALASSGMQVPPQVIIETSTLPKTVKDKLNGMMNQPPNPMQMQAQALELQGAQAKVDDTRASALKKNAEAAKTMQEANLAPAQAVHEMRQDQNEAALRAHQTLHDMQGEADDRAHGQTMDGMDMGLRMRQQRHVESQPQQQTAAP